MKARIKKTGKIVEVFKNKNNVYIDEEHQGHSAESLDFMFDEETHWQDVRERAAIAAMQGLLANPQLFYDNGEEKIIIEAMAMSKADELIRRLKKE